MDIRNRYLFMRRLAGAAEEKEGAYEETTCGDRHQDDGVSVGSLGGG
jgi:hypothetical protein